MRISTGLAGLDTILDGLRLGDNVVWSLDSIDDYRYFAESYVAHALSERRTVVYFRFADHPPVVSGHPALQTFTLDPRSGFEPFACAIHNIATEQGRGVFYVFDSLSDLLSSWATDHMIANFFDVVCPYLYRLDTIAWFALLRGRHARRTVTRIRDTTQVMLDLHHYDGERFLHPIKVHGRRSPTMFLPHRQQGETFYPLANSLEATRLLADVRRRESTAERERLDYWHRLFLEARKLLDASAPEEEQQELVRQLCGSLAGREDSVLDLACRHFTLADLLAIHSRMIGTGSIGGKAMGMLLARKILQTRTDFDWSSLLEEHDSFFVGSNVYYSYIIHNNWWELYAAQKTPEGYFEAATELREKMLEGTFHLELREEFQAMLDYFGQYPIIVRSSSLLEDSFGGAFAGKYESFFRANQGSPAERYKDFENAVRAIFASAMSVDALSYRRQRGLDQHVEQMGLLVQRVSGAYHGHYYFPELAGVGISRNPYVWDPGMDPEAGMLRLVLGLGTRAVDRVPNDYPRIVALDQPMKLPHAGREDLARFQQKEIDLINIGDNAVHPVPITQLLDENIDLHLERYGERDPVSRQTGNRPSQRWLLTFEQLLTKTPFPGIMQKMLQTIETEYHYPVDTEFTVHCGDGGEIRINLLQCRPLQTRGLRKPVQIPSNIDPAAVFFHATGGFMGGNTLLPITQVIQVNAREYARLSLSDKYEVARVIGRLNRRIHDRSQQPTLLLGPGRWGTSTPSLGVPVHFSEINNVVALGEVASTDDNFSPELSFGSHFFQDMVEADIFYLALFNDKSTRALNTDWLDQRENLLPKMLPPNSRLASVVRVCDVTADNLLLLADVVSQELLCHRRPAATTPNP